MRATPRRAKCPCASPARTNRRLLLARRTYSSRCAGECRVATERRRIGGNFPQRNPLDMTRRRLILALAPALALFCAVVLARFGALESSARESEARIRAAQAEHEALRHEVSLGTEVFRLKAEISLLEIERDFFEAEAAGWRRAYCAKHDHENCREASDAL